MCIYEKLSNVQLAIMRRNIKKSGYNKFKKYHYHTLDDLMPACLDECHKEGLTFYFDFTTNPMIYLHVWNSDEYMCCGLSSLKLLPPDDDKNNKNNIIVQDMGAAVTYQKRYLLLDLFNISDVELIDSDMNDNPIESTKNKKSSVKKEGEKVDLPMGKLILQAKDKLVKKGIDEKEITYKTLEQTVLRLKKWTTNEKRYISNYFLEKRGGN